MHSRVLRILLVLIEALWLNVIVPGHQRGSIALPGESCTNCGQQTSASDACCDDQPIDKHPAVPHGDPARHCAICYFAARVTPPVFVDFTLPPLRFLELRPVPAAPICTSFDCLRTYDGRGPPAAT